MTYERTDGPSSTKHNSGGDRSMNGRRLDSSEHVADLICSLPRRMCSGPCVKAEVLMIDDVKATLARAYYLDDL